MTMKRSLIAAFAILACLMFAWATGAGRPYPASAGGVIDPTCTSSSPCIEYDNNGTGPGIRGISVVGNGLSGSTKNNSTSTTNGRAGSDRQRRGHRNANSGVHGLSVNGTGVSGDSTNGDGITGASMSGIAVSGLSTHFVGVDAVGGGLLPSADFPALSIVGDTSPNRGGFTPNDLIDACPQGPADPCEGNDAVFQVDGIGEVHGLVFFSLGGYFKNGACVAGCSSSAASARRVRTYSPQSSEPMIEDNGEAQLVSGTAYVRLDPAFANVTDQRSIYSVSITPEGNSNGLFVTQKTLTGFAVRENNGGKSTLAFEYRIVAKPFGSTAKRLPMVDVPLQRRTIGTRSWHPGGVVPVR